MQEHRSRPSQRVDTRVIYDRQSGEILHVHQAVSLPGIKFPDENELKASAMDLASRATGRHVHQMDVLTVQEEELKPGTRYKVNLRDKCLVPEPSDAATEDQADQGGRVRDKSRN
jgi:hypothetical protein